MDRAPRLFGSPRRTQILVLLALLEESYLSELARLVGVSAGSLIKTIDALEAEGVVMSRPLGRTRRISLNVRYFAAAELLALLLKLAEGDPGVRALAAKRRARPRRRGKPL